MAKDCTTCKYGFVDEQFGFPMCHHPSRFSEDCVDFNMHEEKEEPEKTTGIEEEKLPEGLEEAAVNHVQSVVDAVGHPGWDWETQDVLDAFKSGAEWHAEQGKTYTTEVIMLPGGIKKIQHAVEGFEPGDKVIVQIRRKI